jgi:hypothetical protein
MTTDPADFSLDGLSMNAVETDANGVINVDTTFTFHQSDETVRAEYAGGQVVQGYLVGLMQGPQLTFRYCQLERSGALNGGMSICDLRRSDDGKIQIIEHFEWASRDGGGRNVLQEL